MEFCQFFKKLLYKLLISIQCVTLTHSFSKRGKKKKDKDPGDGEEATSLVKSIM